jgi:CRP-like cAMP-binding protein
LLLSQHPNILLASLAANIFAELSRHLNTVQLQHGVVLAGAESDVRLAYFPHSGVISLVVDLEIGHMIETAMIGRDGVLNALCALDGKVSFNKAIVQMAGEASAIKIEQLGSIAEKSLPLRTMLIRHDQVMFAQAQQSAACNASHNVEARMCRWLLRMRDLANSNDLYLTQEFLAQMLGVQRPSVSLVANTLHRAGLISYRRGNMKLLNIEGLTEGSCECYAKVKRHYDLLTKTAD